MIADDRFRNLFDVRARHPERIAECAAKRRRRPLLGEAGQLFIVAADHPARGALRAGDDAMAMASRRVLLDRIVTALAQPGVDGLLAAPDVLEDLLLLEALHDKVVLGSMNRGGVAGSVWELDDRFTAYDADALERARLEGGKLLLRIDHNDPGTLETLERSAVAVSELAARKLMAVVEVLPASRDAKRALVISRNPDEMITAMCIASGLGTTSAYTWLKIPVVPEMERVMASTTLPTLLLGGDPGARAAEVFAGWRSALTIPQVRGLVAGRSLLYPPDGDVVRAVSTAAAIVHG
jgi:hypothetical protein